MTSAPSTSDPGESVPTGIDPRRRAGVLVETLPYIQRFAGKTIVVKYGGNAMTHPALAERFAEDIMLMHSVGIRPVVVHGGGPQIGDMLTRLGITSEFKDGLRVTDAETLDIARMVLVGKVNRDIVSRLNVHDAVAVGLSGQDAGLIVASERDPELGFVGDVDLVNPAIVNKLLAEDLVPVVSTIGADALGQAYNINADTVAGRLAEALNAERVIYLTDVDGLLADVDDPNSKLGRLTVTETRQLIADGIVAGGMIPKVEACLHAVQNGVGSAHMLNGTVAHVILLELFTDSGVGTMLTPDPVAEGQPAG